MTRTLVFPLWALLTAMVLGGCEPELGLCDISEARRLVYDEGGSPVYEGQAQMIRTCGFGAFCHSGGIDGDARNGVPAGLDYDLRIVSSSGAEGLAETERLAATHARTFRDRRMIWNAVNDGSMPPPISDTLLTGAPLYFRLDGATGAAVPMPGLDTAAGRESLRNWLACSLPIVERDTEATGAGQIGDIVSPRDVMPLEPLWSNIHERLIARRCASAACHGLADKGELRLDGGREAALAAMVGIVSRSTDCGSSTGPLIVPGNPDGSLLMQKLEGRVRGAACTTDAECASPSTCIDALCSTPVCGDLMPIGGSRVSTASLQAIRMWITNGAMND